MKTLVATTLAFSCALALSCARSTPQPSESSSVSASASTPPTGPRSAEVRDGDLVFLHISNQPGVLTDSNAPPPPPGSKPATHPFLTASCGGGRPALCSKARELLLASNSYDGFIAKLRDAGFTVDER